MNTTTETRFRTVKTEGGVELMVDMQSKWSGRDKLGQVLVVTWDAYSRPRWGRYTIGMFGSNFVNSDLCHYMGRYRVYSLTSPVEAQCSIDDPAFERAEGPELYAALEAAWATVPASSE